MHKGNNKRGLMPSQPAAAIAALDFAHQWEAFRRALQIIDSAADFATRDAANEEAARIADSLLSIPVRQPQAISAKVAAYAWWHLAGSPDLSDPATQWRIADSDNDAAKGLLAVYLDLARLSEAGA